MFSRNFRQSLSIMLIFFICFMLGKITYYLGILSISLISRMILASCILLVFIKVYITSRHKWQSSITVSKLVVKYKMYSYAAVIFCSVLWSYIATLLQAGFIDYTIDILCISPLIMLGMYFYTICVDSRITAAQDMYYEFGMALAKADIKTIWRNKNFLRLLMLKSQFLPFMYAITLISIEHLLNIKDLFNIHEFFANLFIFGVMFDVLIGLFGYIFTSKVLENKIISIDTHFLGWFFCLLCYPPFYYFLQNAYPVFEYPIPADWLINNEISNIATYFILSLQTLCWIIYWWSTWEFGLQFSNLTWRGLVNTGPYKYCKHPAYLAKNLYWWLSLLPYLCTVTPEQEIKLVLGLCLISTVYFCRAKCEERHLKQFVTYQHYCRTVPC